MIKMCWLGRKAPKATSMMTDLIRSKNVGQFHLRTSTYKKPKTFSIKPIIRIKINSAWIITMWPSPNIAKTNLKLKNIVAMGRNWRDIALASSMSPSIHFVRQSVLNYISLPIGQIWCKLVPCTVHILWISSKSIQLHLSYCLWLKKGKYSANATLVFCAFNFTLLQSNYIWWLVCTISLFCIFAWHYGVAKRWKKPRVKTK